jgi:hypothetical protein
MANANAPSVTGANQPSSGAWMSPKTRLDTPTIDRSAPIGSSSACAGSRDFGTKNHPPAIARAMTGR